MKYLIPILVGLGLSTATAQPFITNKSIICDTLEEVVKVITGPDINEKPMVFGEDNDSKYILTVNEKTGSWSFIQTDGKIGCLVGFGVNFKVIITPSGKRI